MSTEASLTYGTVQNYIDGEWVTPSEDGMDVVNPARGESIARVGFSSTCDIDAAVAAGQESFEQWRTRPVKERIQPLFELKRLLEDHQEELAKLLVQEHGKTRAERGANSGGASRTSRRRVAFRR